MAAESHIRGMSEKGYARFGDIDRRVPRSLMDRRVRPTYSFRHFVSSLHTYTAVEFRTCVLKKRKGRKTKGERGFLFTSPLLSSL